MSKSIWETLSSIDCSDHIEKKGKFDYLAWTWAWAMVKERYPLARYELLDDITYADGTMEVRVEVNIHGGPLPVENGSVSQDSVGLSHTMWLPVLNYQNKPIANPDAYEINTARMRCLVKCLAMFGLGHYIYAGESAPQAPDYTEEQRETLLGILAAKDSFELRLFTEQVGQDVMDALFNSAPDGQKTRFKDQVRKLYGQSNQAIKDGLAAVEEIVGAEIPDPSALHEAFSEMGELERKYVKGAMNEVLTKQVEDLIGADLP